MSSISGTGLHPGTLPALQNDQATQTQQTSEITPGSNNGTSGAYYTQLDFDHPSVSSLGLRTPSNSGDAEALLAEVALLLEKTSAEQRSNRDRVLNGELTAGLQSLLQNSATLAALAASNISLGNEVTQDQADLAVAQTKLADDQVTLGKAQDAYTQAVKDNKGVAAALTALQQAQSAVSGDQTTIGNLQTAISTDQAKINTNNATFQALQSAFLNVFAPIAAGVDRQQPANKLDDHGHDLTQNQSFDTIFQNLQRLVDRFQTEQANAPSETSDTQTQTDPSRDGSATNATRTALGLLTGLVDVLTTLSQLQPTSTGLDDGSSSFQGGSRVKLPL